MSTLSLDFAIPQNQPLRWNQIGFKTLKQQLLEYFERQTSKLLFKKMPPLDQRWDPEDILSVKLGHLKQEKLESRVMASPLFHNPSSYTMTP